MVNAQPLDDERPTSQPASHYRLWRDHVVRHLLMVMRATAAARDPRITDSYNVAPAVPSPLARDPKAVDFDD
jgi:hypothetical protein